jgi:hypothetical protein
LTGFIRFWNRVSHSPLSLWKQSQKIIHSENLVELVVKLVETRYSSKSKKKAFIALKGSTNYSGLKLNFKAPFLARVEFTQLSKDLNLWIFRINQVEDGTKYLWHRSCFYIILEERAKLHEWHTWQVVVPQLSLEGAEGNQMEVAHVIKQMKRISCLKIRTNRICQPGQDTIFVSWPGWLIFSKLAVSTGSRAEDLQWMMILAIPVILKSFIRLLLTT